MISFMKVLFLVTDGKRVKILSTLYQHEEEEAVTWMNIYPKEDKHCT